jgi:hypothetical protein
MKLILSCAALALVLCACASQQPMATDEPVAADKHTPTGSNIPRRTPQPDATKTLSPEQMEQMRNAGRTNMGGGLAKP